MTAVLLGLDGLFPRGIVPEGAGVGEMVRAVVDTRCPCGLISNVGADDAIELRAHPEVLDMFDAVVLASEIGVAMPDPRAYAVAVDALGAKAGATVFLGCDPEHLEGAREAGLAAVSVASPEEVADQLAAISAGRSGQSGQLGQRNHAKQIKLKKGS